MNILAQEEKSTAPHPYAWHIERFCGDERVHHTVEFEPMMPEILANLKHHYRVEVTPLHKEVPAANEVLAVLRKARADIERNAEQCGYGFYRPANPHHFSPDAECCSEDEIAAHKAACEAFDKGEYTPEKGTEWISDKMHILRTPWGIGGYTYIDDQSAALLAEIDAAIAAAEGRAA